ncbi:MAG: hypothetical protein HRU15_06180, partial [Planctomycetes bacterium]|nr:hypothetical protein [Planctomycetota bacterium]
IPKLNTPIKQAFLSHVAASCKNNFIELLQKCLATAHEAGIDQIVIGCGDGHYLLPWIKEHSTHEYFSNNWYMVHDQDQEVPKGVYHLEVGTL